MMRQLKKNSCKNTLAGVTLVELMIVIAIIAIIAAFVVPSYLSYAQRSKRTEATSALLAWAAEQEKYVLENNQYAPDAATLGLDAQTFKNYTITLTSDPAAGTFTLTADAKNDTSQASDDHCQKFSIDQTGNRSVVSDGGQVFTDECWP